MKQFPPSLLVGSGMELKLVGPSEITTEVKACLRCDLNFPRIKQLTKRAEERAQFPPLILFQKLDKKLILIDGWSRMVAFRALGINLFPALVIHTCLEDALIEGLRRNMPKDGKLRGGSDANRALSILATALNRPINEAEAVSLGLRYTPNAPLPDYILNAMGMPSLPPPLPNVRDKKTVESPKFRRKPEARPRNFRKMAP